MTESADDRLAQTLARDGTLRPDQIDAALKTQVDMRRRGQDVALSDVIQLPDGQRFGPYILLKQLGKGGMGVVWKAWDSRLGRPVALKQILGEDPTDADQVPRFMAEARASARLHHPNIVALHDLGVESGKHFFTMDFVDGVSLKDAAAAERLSPRRALEIVRDVARALHYAHQQGIVHRDIKPANILLDAAGRPFVTDFGLAKDVSRAAGAGLTLSGQVLGTPNYLSPEQARGSAKSVGPASDQFSLGVTLFELLTGRVPFSGEGIHDLLDAIVNKEASSIGSGIHRDIETIVHRSLEKDPARRYATLDDFAADIHRYLEGEPILARRLSSAARLWRRAVKHKYVTIPTLAALALALAFGAYAIVTSRQKTNRILANLRDAAALEKTDPSAAEKRYAAVLGLDRDNPDAKAGLARIETRRRDEARDAEKRERDVTLLVEAARPALDKATSYLYKDTPHKLLLDQVDIALAKLDEALQLKPGSSIVHALIGRAWQLKGFDDKAEASFRKAIELDPASGAAHFQLGLLLVYRAFYINARDSVRNRVLDRGVRYVPASAPVAAEGQKEIEAAGRLGGFENEVEQKIAEFLVAYTRVPPDVSKLYKKPGEAAAAFAGRDGFEVLLWINSTYDVDSRQANLDQAIAFRPKFAEARFFRGYVRAASGDPRAAVADYSVAVELRPREPLFYHVRAQAFDALGETRAALDDYTQAMTLDPAYDDPVSARAFLRYRTGDIQGAYDDYDAIIRSRRTVTDSYFMRACALAALKDYRSAIPDFEHAAKISAPFDARPYYHLGLAHAAAGDPGAAVVAFSNALYRDARHEQAAFQKGLLCADLGRHDEAADAFLRALDVAPPGWKDRPAALARLDALAPTHAAAARLRAFRAVDPAAALAEIDKALELDPASVDARAFRAAALINLNRHTEAVETLDAALGLQPNNPTLLLLRSRAFLLLPDPDKALADATAAAALCSDDPAFPLQTALAYIQKNKPASANLELGDALRLDPSYLPALVERACLRADARDGDGALADAGRALEIDPSNLRALNARGRAHLIQKNWDAAIADFSSLVKLDPSAYWGFYNRGLARKGKSDSEAAVADFSECLRLRPDYDSARFERARALRLLGRHNSAVDDWTAYLSRWPKNASALNNRALSLHESGDSARALVDYDAAVALDPKDAVALANRADARAAVGDLEGARKDFDGVLSLQPKDAWTLQRRAAVRLKIEPDPDGALQDLDAAVALGSPSSSLLTLRASALKRAGKTDLAFSDLDHALKLRPSNLDALLLRARLSLLRGNPDAALKDVDDALKASPLSAEAHLIRGLALRCKGDLDAAATALIILADVITRPAGFPAVVRDALEDQPDSIPPSESLNALLHLLLDEVNAARSASDPALRAFVCLVSRDFDRAAAAVEDALKSAPKDPPLLLLRARVRIERGDADGAAADLTAVLNADAVNASARYYMAKARALQNDNTSALAEYDAAIRLNPLDARALNNRGLIRETSGDVEGALTDFTLALRIDPLLVQPWSNRASLRAARGDLNGALDDLDAAVRLHPADPGRRLDRADLRLKKSDAAGALADCEAVLAADPKNADARFSRARARIALADYDGAIEDNTAVIAADPADGAAYFNRALAYLGKKDVDAAVADFEKARDRFPEDSPTRREIESRLDALKKKP